MEQHIRAERAQDLGLVRMLSDNGSRDAHLMATALRNLPQQRRPSEVVVPGLLDGPANVVRLADYWLKHGSRRLTVAGPRSKGRRGGPPAPLPWTRPHPPTTYRPPPHHARPAGGC